MPLKQGYSDATLEKNIQELFNANANKPKNERRSPEQIYAIAKQIQRKAKRKKKG